MRIEGFDFVSIDGQTDFEQLVCPQAIEERVQKKNNYKIHAQHECTLVKV